MEFSKNERITMDSSLSKHWFQDSFLSITITIWRYLSIPLNVWRYLSIPLNVWRYLSRISQQQPTSANNSKSVNRVLDRELKLWERVDEMLSFILKKEMQNWLLTSFLSPSHYYLYDKRFLFHKWREIKLYFLFWTCVTEKQGIKHTTTHIFVICFTISAIN